MTAITPRATHGHYRPVFALADAMPARFSALVVVAALSGLRWGEPAALRRRDVTWTPRSSGCRANSPC